jgi:hypothetical protein
VEQSQGGMWFVANEEYRKNQNLFYNQNKKKQPEK